MTEPGYARNGAALTWRAANFDGLTTRELYAILAARVAVFVVEQDCPYQEADGLDPVCVHLWAANAVGEIAAYARLTPPASRFAEPSIGRVLTALPYRRTGLGRDLMRRTLQLAERQFPKRPLRISAQQYLQRFYAAFGFEFVRGPYPEDGIPHIEMLRPGISEQRKR